MTVEATVLIPTHDHGHLLGYSVRSALEQSVSDIEVFIVGDGMDEATRGVAAEMAGGDGRVRVFDNPKGPRHGEAHRHEALQEASGRIICYLSDDDLFLPEHVATMLEMLATADFAHSVPVGVRPDGSLETWVGHLGVPSSRARVVGLQNFIPFSCGAHTLELYRRLPNGWRTTPAGVHTDVFMWSQLLGAPECVARSGDKVTALAFPSPWRESMGMDERREELAHWRQRMREPDFAAHLNDLVVRWLVKDRADVDDLIRSRNFAVEDLEAERERLLTRIEELETGLREIQHHYSEANARIEYLSGSLAEAGDRVDALERDLELLRSDEDHLRRERDMMLDSLTWRTRERILRLPGVAGLARLVGRARSRRGGT